MLRVCTTWGCWRSCSSHFSCHPLPVAFSRASSRPLEGPGPQAQPLTMCSVSSKWFAGGRAKAQGESPGGGGPGAEESQPQMLQTSVCGHRVRRLGFLTMTNSSRFTQGPQVEIHTRPSTGCLWVPQSAAQEGFPGPEGGRGSGVDLLKPRRSWNLSMSQALVGYPVLGVRDNQKEEHRRIIKGRCY